MVSGFRFSICAAAAAVLVGCSSVKLEDTPVESRTPTVAAPSADGADGGAAARSGVASASGVVQSQVATIDLNRSGASGAAGAAGGVLGRTVYFDYDSFVVKDDYRALIESHAKLLAANKARRLLVEGHTDERGGREYNLALGQKRAEAVAKSLVLMGAAESQIEAVSYGKERPADTSGSEDAWAKNRRAELKDR